MENIKVVVRVKPLTAEEKEEGAENVIRILPDGQKLQVNVPAGDSDAPVEPATPAKTPNRPTTPRKAQTPRGEKGGSRTSQLKTFTFDCVYGPEIAQREIFKDVESYVTAAVDGFNATVFAYGQTGAGKTHTMAGPSHDPGIIPRAVSRMFEAIAAKPNVTFTIRVSFVELHLDHFIDLLDPELSSGGSRKRTGTPGPEKRRPKLEIHEVQNGDTKDVFLTGSDTLRTQVGSEEEVNALIERGSRMRAVSATRLNEVSSRSHTILTFHIEGKQADSNVTQFGKLHLVDLAGSERLKRSGAEGDTQKETLNINSSLTALADVLSALSAPAVGGQAPAVIPYRNSKLTRLLQDSLGGNSKTFFIVNVHPSSANFRETLMSLQYGQRAKLIRNNVAVNKEVTLVNDAEVKQLQLELAELRKQLEERTKELEELRISVAQKAETVSEEEATLKQKIARLSSANDKERLTLERRLSTVSHSHKSELAEQQLAYATLQARVDDFKQQVHSMKVKQVLDQDDIESLRELLREARAEIAASVTEKGVLQDEKASLEEQLKEQERRAETEAGALAKKVKELEGAINEEKKRARQLVREEKDEAGIARAEAEEKAEALQVQLAEKNEEIARLRADDAKRIKQLEKQLAAVEGERETARKNAEALEEAKRDLATRTRRIEALRAELEQAQQGRAATSATNHADEEKKRESKKHSKKRSEERSDAEGKVEKKKEKKEKKEKPEQKETKEREQKAADETVVADEWDDVPLDVRLPVAPKEKKSKKHSEDNEKKEKKEKAKVEKVKEKAKVPAAEEPAKKPADESAPIPAETVPEVPRRQHLQVESIQRKGVVEKVFSSPAKSTAVAASSASLAPIVAAKPPSRPPMASPLRQAAEQAQRERAHAAATSKKNNKRASDNENDFAPPPQSKLPRPSPLKAQNTVLPVVSAEPKKRKLLNDKTAFSLSPAIAAAQADKPAAVAAAGTKKPISSLRELFKNGNLKIPKLLAK